jgi:integrase
MSIKKVLRGNGETKWEVRVHENGRGSKRIKRTFDKKIEAEKFLFDFTKELKEKAASPYKECSFNGRKFKDEAEYWLSDGELRFSRGHIVRAKGVLRELYLKLGELSLDRFTPELLSKLQQGEKTKGLANSTVNRKTEIIMAILNYSAKHKRIPFNPALGFSKLKKSSKEMSFWSENEATSFLGKVDEMYPAHHEKRWVYIAYLLALNAGLRAGEIWGLKPMDISQDGKSLWIRRQFNRVTLDFGPTKGKKSRHVPCPGVVLQELKLWIGRNLVKPEETVFRNHQGKPICHDNFSDRQFLKDLKAWGGRSIRFHDLRHTATTLMIARGFDIKTVKEVCGHADISTTMNYVHMVSGSVERLSEQFVISPRKEEGDRKLELVI